MHSSTILTIATTLLASHVLAQKQASGSSSSANACAPSNPDLDENHPCVEVAELERQCIPKPEMGTQQGCLCSSGYFHAWRGCLACMHVHGQRSDDETNYLNAVMDKASLQYCENGPSVKGGGFEDEFQMIMKQGRKAVEYKAGDKEVHTLEKGKTVDVEEYYTRLGDMVAAEPSTSTSIEKPTATGGYGAKKTEEAEVKGTVKAAAEKDEEEKSEKSAEENDEKKEEESEDASEDKSPAKETQTAEASSQTSVKKDSTAETSTATAEKEEKKDVEEEQNDESAATKQSTVTAAVALGALFFAIM